MPNHVSVPWDKLVTSLFESEGLISNLNFFENLLPHKARRYTIQYGALARKRFGRDAGLARPQIFTGWVGVERRKISKSEIESCFQKLQLNLVDKGSSTVIYNEISLRVSLDI